MGTSSKDRTPRVYVKILGNKVAISAKNADATDPKGRKPTERVAKNPKTGVEKTVWEWLDDSIQGQDRKSTRLNSSHT